MRNPFVSVGAMVRRQWDRLVEAAGGQEAKLRRLRKSGVRIGDRCRIYTEQLRDRAVPRPHRQPLHGDLRRPFHHARRLVLGAAR